MFLYIQRVGMSEKIGRSEPAAGDQKTPETRSKGVYVRLTKTEQKQLKELSQQLSVSVSTLLRTGVLGQLDRLPVFQKLPTDVTAQLSKLDRLTTALWFISQRADADAIYAQDIRDIVYRVGAISQQVHQFCEQNKTRLSTITLLDGLIRDIQQKETASIGSSTLLQMLTQLRNSYSSKS
jgi:small-conductance mechanosensitive channel